MKRRLQSFALATSLLLIAGCAATVQTDFARSDDLAALRTFHVLDEPLSVPDDPTLTTPFSHEALREEIRHALHERGFRPSGAKAADFLVGFHIVYDRRVAALDRPDTLHRPANWQPVGGRHYRGGRSFRRFGGFGRYGYGGLGGFGSGDIAPRIVGEGTLVIDIIDRRSGQLVWRGWSHRRLGGARPDPDRIADTLGALVPRILDAFPPDRTAAASERDVQRRQVDVPAPLRAVSTEDDLIL